MKYRKRPVVIDAVQIRRDNHEEWQSWVASHPVEFTIDTETIRGRKPFATTFKDMTVLTAEGLMHGSINDWLIQGVKGEFYFCKPDIFEMTYEPWEEIPEDDDRVPPISEPFYLVDDEIDPITRRRQAGKPEPS